jgi:hypothetical protein
MTALLHRSRRLLLLLAVAIGLTLAIGTSTPASAGQPDASHRARNYYGAISISVDAAWGVSYDYGTKAKAIKRAKVECKKHSDYPGKCVNAVWVRNGCAAVSVKYNSEGFVSHYGWAVNRFKGPAIRAAQHKCGNRCQKLTWVCTTRP